MLLLTSREDLVADLLASLGVDEGGRLGEAQLDAIASEVAANPVIWADLAVGDVPETRQRRLLYRSENVEVLLLIWSPSEASDWHDHGGASGGYAVVEGQLDERYRGRDGFTVERRRLGPGSHGAFGAAHVHDVMPAEGTAAVSVHCYSPPIAAMTYYEWTPFGFMAREVVPED